MHATCRDLQPAFQGIDALPTRPPLHIQKDDKRRQNPAAKCLFPSAPLSTAKVTDESLTPPLQHSALAPAIVEPSLRMGR